MYNIAIAGTGYVGLVVGTCFAQMGHKVTCVDIDERKIRYMTSGSSPIYEYELEDYMQRNYKAGRLHFTIDYQSAYQYADIIFICVGTPERIDGSANLTYVYDAAKHIAHSVEKDCVVVIKSTVPIGTSDRIEAFIWSELKHKVHVHVATNPEFFSHGTAIQDTLEASRIVIGVKCKFAETVLRRAYSSLKNVPVIVTSRCTAEMIKYACNDFLALKISYINEIANICEVYGVDVTEVAEGMGYDGRIGSQFLNAGIGFGGACFPKDTRALHWLANAESYELKTIKAAIEVNEFQKLRLIKKARHYYESFEGLTVAVLGLTFKPGTDDVRSAPSLANIPILLDERANVRAWDPYGSENFMMALEQYGCQYDAIEYYDTIDETIKGADLCFIFTEWSEIVEYDIYKYAKLMKQPIILDGRNCYRVEEALSASIHYESIGRMIMYES